MWHLCLSQGILQTECQIPPRPRWSWCQGGCVVQLQLGIIIQLISIDEYINRLLLRCLFSKALIQKHKFEYDSVTKTFNLN